MNEYMYIYIEKFWLKEEIFRTHMIGLITQKEDEHCIPTLVLTKNKSNLYSYLLFMEWNEIRLKNDTIVIDCLHF